MAKLTARGYELLDPGHYALEVVEAEPVNEYGPQLKLRAMTWWVAALINREVSDIEIGSQSRLSPLAPQFREYRDFAEQDTSMADSTVPHSPVELFDRPSVRLAIEAARGLRAITMTSV